MSPFYISGSFGVIIQRGTIDEMFASINKRTEKAHGTVLHTFSQSANESDMDIMGQDAIGNMEHCIGRMHEMYDGVKDYD